MSTAATTSSTSPSGRLAPVEDAGVSAAVAAARAAAPDWAATPRSQRAAIARAIGRGLRDQGADIVALASAESHLPAAPLGVELTRTAWQWDLFAEVVEEGSYLEATIDNAGQTPAGPRPDLRRMLVPTGPVAVFGASNFPLAFSTAGGDTASALAIGCPVIVKTHPSHPRTSALVGEILHRVLTEHGAPEGTFGSVEGREAGVALVQHPDVTAVAFTGSLAGGQALLGFINQRLEPIPFYGELSSANPVVVTRAAAAQRAETLADGLVASITGRQGQLCTKPGLVLVPAGPDGDRFAEAASNGVRAASGGQLLNEGIQTAFRARTAELGQDARLQVIAQGTAGDGAVVPTLVSVDADQLTSEMLAECFGPVTLLVRYRDPDEVYAALDLVEGSLAATLHHEPSDADAVGPLIAALTPKVGRILFEGYSTGLSVSWAQHHGGPWPATNSIHTSVGATAVRRFLRPVTWQDAPEFALPVELRNGAPIVPVRIDGRLRLPADY